MSVWRGFGSIESAKGEPPFFCPFEESLFLMARRAKDPEKRIQSLEARLEKDPASPAFFPLAHLLLAKEQDARAEGLLRQGLEIFPAYAAARVLLGKILHSKGLFEDAVIELEAAARISPWNLEAQRLLADSYLNSGDEAGAQRARAIVGMFDPLSEEGRAALGVAPAPVTPATKENRAKEETPAPPGEAEAVPTLSLAELYTSQGHLDKAADVYRRLLEEDPGNDDLGEKLSAIEAQIGAGAADAAAEIDLEGLGLEGLEGEFEAAPAEGESSAQAEETAVEAAVELPELDEDLGAELDGLVAGEEAEATAAAEAVGLDEDLGAGFEMLTDEEETPPAEGACPGEEPRDPIQEEFLSEELEEVSPGEGAGESVEVVQPETGIDSTLEGLVQLYVDEGNFEHALDLCRKSAVLGGESPTLTALIRGLEQKLTEDRALVPGAAPSVSVSSQEVVAHLEKWLRTLQDRKAEPSANGG